MKHRYLTSCTSILEDTCLCFYDNTAARLKVLSHRIQCDKAPHGAARHVIVLSH